MNYSIGVDIGGTKVAIAIVNENGEIVEQSIIPTDLSIAPQAMIARISTEVKQIVKRSDVSMESILGVGVGAPGPLDSRNGMITCPPNLPQWIDIPLVELMQATLPFPVTLENDANAAALAEKWIGAAQGNENFAYMTVSTGIGAGIVTDGKLLRGARGNAGDIGHTVVDPSFGKCTCGQYGCLEWIASGTGIARHGSAALGRELSTKEVFELYEEGNPTIVALIDRIFRVLGVACVSIVNTLDPEKIVLGGGVTKVGTPLFNSIREYVSKYALSPTGRETEIVPAKLEQEAGVIGAAALI